MKKLLVLGIVFMFLLANLGYGLAPAPGDNPTVKKELKKESKKKDPTDPIVYVKEKGKKYHKKMCKVAGTGKTGIKLSEALKRGYTACAICKPPIKSDKKKKITTKKSKK